jgi:hypothetical protein
MASRGPDGRMQAASGRRDRPPEYGGGSLRTLGLVLVAGVLASCAAPTADPSLDAAAKLFHAPADKAWIYVVPAVSTSEVTVTLDGRSVGTLGRQNFLRLEVPPGRHVLYVTPVSLLAVFSHEPRDDMTVEVEPGQCYYFRTTWTEFERTWRHLRVYLERMKEEDGRQAVNVRTLLLPGH